MMTGEACPQKASPTARPGEDTRKGAERARTAGFVPAVPSQCQVAAGSSALCTTFLRCTRARQSAPLLLIACARVVCCRPHAIPRVHVGTAGTDEDTGSEVEMYESDGALFIKTAAGRGDLVVDGTRIGGALRALETKVGCLPSSSSSSPLPRTHTHAHTCTLHAHYMEELAT